MLLCVLWSSDLIGTFAITGMTLLLGSLLGIYQTHLQNVDDQTQSSTVLKVLTQIVGPNFSRITQSNVLQAFKKNLETDEKQPTQDKQFEWCCIV